MNKIGVSILPILAEDPVDFSKLEAYLYKISTADYLHIDVMDGKFVPEKTIWTDEVSKINTELVKHVHLMVLNPENCVADFVDAGADIVTFHVEATKKHKEVIKKIKEKNAKAGISLNIETPLSSIKDFVNLVDLVLIMPIHPGAGGRPFDKKALTKIKELRKLRKDLDIAVDGGVDEKTGELCVKAGANILCSGSYIYKHEDPKIAIDILRNL